MCAYIGRAVFVSTRVEYDPSSGDIRYRTAKGAELSLDALEWIALVTRHIPNPGEHTRHYFGYYSNAARGKRRKLAAGGAANTAAGADSETDHCESEDLRRECRRSWARLIQKVYEVDPLVCPDCGGRFEVIAFIDAPQIIRKILEHLHLWDLPALPPPAPLLQGKTDALAARGNGSGPGPPDQTAAVFVDDLPAVPRLTLRSISVDSTHGTRFPFFLPLSFSP